MPFSSPGISYERSVERREDIKKTFKTIIEAAKTEKADVLLICGDLYEHSYVRKPTIAFVNEGFKEIPDTRVFIVPGNHDPYILNSFYKTFEWAENVTILSQDNPYVILEGLNTCIYGVGFNSFYEGKSPAYEIKPIKPDYLNILMVHGTVDLNIKKSMYNPMSSDNLSRLGMDYIAVGHFHNKIEDIGAYGSIYNSGSPEALGFDEPGEHGFFIGELSKNEAGEKKLDIRFVNSGCKRYVSLEVDIDAAQSDKQIIEAIRNKINCNDSKNVLYSITLKGYTDAAYMPEIPKIAAALKEEYFYLKIKDETRPQYDFQRIVAEPGIKGLFARKVLSLIDKSEDEYEKKLLLKALYYGLEAIEYGSVRITE